MSQMPGDYGSILMGARSQYEQNAKRKTVIIPKGTTFKNIKIRSNYDNKNGTYYLSTLGVKDEKRGAYDIGERSFKESDFKVTKLLEAGYNFFKVQNFLVVKNNGFDISENAIVDIELNKDISVSIFDEPFVDPIFPTTQNTNSYNLTQAQKDVQKELLRLEKLTKEAQANQNQQRPRTFYEMNQGYIFIGLALVAGYFAYKKFKK